MAREFPGSTNTDRITTGLTSHAGDDLYSISIWYWMDGADTTARRIFDKKGSANGDGILIFRDNNATHNYGFQLIRATNKGEWRWDKTTTGEWIHLFVAYDASSTTNDPVIYVDGSAASLTKTQTPDGAVDVSTNPYLIGNRERASVYTRCWDGKLAHFAVWHGAVLSAGEVGALFRGASPLTMRPNRLVGYWPIYGVSPEPDLAPNPGSVTITGTTVPTNSAPVGRPVPPPSFSPSLKSLGELPQLDEKLLNARLLTPRLVSSR